MTYTVQQIVLTFATALGAYSYNGFPETPSVFKNFIKNELVQWALLWVVIYQGGSGQDLTLTTLVTAAMFAANKSLV